MVLEGVTGIRVRMGITQETFARYLGISKSLVSMVENKRRSLPFAALTRLSELEISFQKEQAGKAYAIPDHEETGAEKMIREGRDSINRLRLLQLQSEYDFKMANHDEIILELQQLDKAIDIVRQQGCTASLHIFEAAKTRLLKKLKPFNAKARAKIQGKIAMLQIIMAACETSLQVPPQHEIIPDIAPANTITPATHFDIYLAQEISRQSRYRNRYPPLPQSGGRVLYYDDHFLEKAG